MPPDPPTKSVLRTLLMASPFFIASYAPVRRLGLTLLKIGREKFLGSDRFESGQVDLPPCDCLDDWIHSGASASRHSGATANRHSGASASRHS